MQASLFEFRNRVWFFFFLFTAAFLCYFLDPVNAGAATVNWLAKRWGTVPSDNSYRLIFALATVLVAVAAAIRTWGTSYLKAEVMRDERIHTDRLLADGPFRYVRNPLYFANILMGLGIGFMASRVGFVVLTVGMVVFVYRLILREEAELLRDQGESYRRYLSVVPRLLPSLTPRVPPAGNVPQWREGVRGETMYWLMAGSLAVFTVTLDVRFFWIAFSGGMALSWLAAAVAKRQSKQKELKEI